MQGSGREGGLAAIVAIGLPDWVSTLGAQIT